MKKKNPNPNLVNAIYIHNLTLILYRQNNNSL